MGIKGRKESEGIVYDAEVAYYIRKILRLGLLRLTFLELQEDLEPEKNLLAKGSWARRQLFFFTVTLDICDSSPWPGARLHPKPHTSVY